MLAAWTSTSTSSGPGRGAGNVSSFRFSSGAAAAPGGRDRHREGRDAFPVRCQLAVEDAARPESGIGERLLDRAHHVAAYVLAREHGAPLLGGLFPDPSRDRL